MPANKMLRVIVTAGLALAGPPAVAVTVGASCNNSPQPPREGPPPPPDCDMSPFGFGCVIREGPPPPPDMTVTDGSGDAAPRG